MPEGPYGQGWHQMKQKHPLNRTYSWNLIACFRLGLEGTGEPRYTHRILWSSKLKPSPCSFCPLLRSSAVDCSWRHHAHRPALEVKISGTIHQWMWGGGHGFPKDQVSIGSVFTPRQKDQLTHAEPHCIGIKIFWQELGFQECVNRGPGGRLANSCLKLKSPRSTQRSTRVPLDRKGWNTILKTLILDDGPSEPPWPGGMRSKWTLTGLPGMTKESGGTLSADQHRWSYNNLLQPANHRCYPQKPDSLFHSLPCQDYNWLMWATQAVLPSPTSINDIHSFMVKKQNKRSLQNQKVGEKK